MSIENRNVIIIINLSIWPDIQQTLTFFNRNHIKTYHLSDEKYYFQNHLNDSIWMTSWFYRNLAPAYFLVSPQDWFQIWLIR